MNEFQVFQNELFKVSAKAKGEQISFDVEQVAISLGFTTVAKSGNTVVRWTRVNKYLPSNSPKVAKGDFVPEPLVYKLAFKASNDLAEKFQDWLAIEVIPSIRTQGAYATPDTIENVMNNPDFGIQLLTNLKQEREERAKLEQQRRLDEPYTTFGKAVSNSTAAINVGAFAKMMYDEYGIKLGRNKMFGWLRDNEFLIKSGREKNQPKQSYLEQGLFDTSVTVIAHNTKGNVQHVTTLITGKGQVKLSKLLIHEFGVTA